MSIDHCGSDADSGARPGDIGLAVIILAGAAGYTQQTPTQTGIRKNGSYWVVYLKPPGVGSSSIAVPKLSHESLVPGLPHLFTLLSYDLAELLGMLSS